MNDALTAEQQFYFRYDWCLNAALPLEDLLPRLREEIDQFPTLNGWQRDDSKANLYLFACAIACTADDYFTQHWLNLSPLSSRFPQFEKHVTAAQMLLDTSRSLLRTGVRAAWRWRNRWQHCLERACVMLLAEAPSDNDAFEVFKEDALELITVRLPQDLFKKRMRLPEAFRAQDMAHHDVITLIRKYCERFKPSEDPIIIIGLRTAGAYFAPLMTEYLKMHGMPRASWFSIRPKNGIARWESQRLQNIRNQNARVLLVDDYPSSGNTIKMTLAILRGFSIRPDQIVVVAPTHPAAPNWVDLADVDKATPVITIHSQELYKNTVLAARPVESICREYFAPQGWNEARLLRDDRIEEINTHLAAHSKDGHHVREKRVVAIELSRDGHDRACRKLFFKSVGWGWLGYHAYIAGTRLAGFVPRVIGLRNGLLLMEWMENSSPIPDGDGSIEMIPKIAGYVAARSKCLRLTGDCHFESRTYRWTGSDEILGILRSVYGPYINRLKIPALRKEIQKYVSAMPTLVDGRMRPEEWVRGHDGTYKTDFEHHNFGGGEADIVDPAYDLAAAIFEFGLTQEAEREVLRLYSAETGDSSIGQRILLHKILYGTTVARHALDSVSLGKEPEKNNTRYQAARNFLAYSMTDFCGRLTGATKPPHWYQSLFFMDLDGVFDQELLGFPHATASGLLSLALLRSRDFSVVLNTGRSIDHVKFYCDAYGLHGGIAEFGAVFVDAVHGREVPLINATGAEELARCREAIKQLPGVFMDPGYRYSIRAYRYAGRSTMGLEAGELKALLSSAGLSHLDYIARAADSYIVQKRTSKSVALAFVCKHVGSAVAVTAIGDSNQDVGMLKKAEFAYAPSNCSAVVRQLAKQGHCRIVKRRFQTGLLAAVRHRLRQEGARLEMPQWPVSDHFNAFMQTVLTAADRRVVFQLLVALSWWYL